MNIKALAEQYDGYIIEQRRYFHARPELSFEERETTRAISEQLCGMGLTPITFPGHNGVMAEIKGSGAGKTVLLRADIDALPVEEKTGLPFAAGNGKMHACGHDCHTAMLLGAAKILCDCKDWFPGTVRLLFQEGEEGIGGSEYYVGQGVTEGVDAVFGMHVWGEIDAPLFCFDDGPRMAACDTFSITVRGKSAHGASPHLGRDAIVAASVIVLNLQTMVSRNNDPLDPMVVTVGTIHGGQRHNIIANEAVLSGTVRCYSRERQKKLRGEMEAIAAQTAAALGCSAELDYQFEAGPLSNDYPEPTRLAREAVVRLYGEESLIHFPPLSCSEDFYAYLEQVPGVFGLLGALTPGSVERYPNHSDRFTVDERALHRGAAVYAQFAVDLLTR